MAEIDDNKEEIKQLEDWNEELQSEKEEQQAEIDDKNEMIMKLQKELVELRMKVDGKSA